MNRLVVHHIYSGGIACDLSGYRIHPQTESPQSYQLVQFVRASAGTVSL